MDFCSAAFFSATSPVPGVDSATAGRSLAGSTVLLGGWAHKTALPRPGYVTANRTAHQPGPEGFLIIEVMYISCGVDHFNSASIRAASWARE